MTISSTPAIVQYNGDGATVLFTVPFYFLNASDLIVTKRSTAGTDATLTLGIDYTVSGAGNANGGSITMTVAPTGGSPPEKLTITSDPIIQQQVHYLLNGLFPSTDTEAALDLLTRIAQVARRHADRGMRAPDSDVNPNMLLPSAALRGAGSGTFPHFAAGSGDIELVTQLASGTALSQSIIGQLLYGIQTPAEAAAGVTPVNSAYVPGDLRRYGCIADGVTDNTVAFQNALNASAGAYPVLVPAGASFYKLTGRVTTPASTHIILMDGPELRWTATTATGSNFLGVATRPGIEVTGNNFLLEGIGTLTGPTVGAYVGNECGIYMTGTSSTVKKSGFRMKGAIEIKNWGSYGVLLQFTDDIEFEGPRLSIHDVGYAGALFSSCNHGRIRQIQVGSITPGTAGNCYGISLSSDSTNYNLDPNAGTKQAANPFCWDWVVQGCTVYDIPLWTGLDAHGAYETHFVDNNIFNCGIGINLSSQSGAGANYAGWDNSVVGNVVDLRRRDGTATQTTTQKAGIIVNGGQTVRHQRVTVARNKTYGCGIAPATWNSIEATLTQDAIIADNQIDNWAGYGIYATGSTGIISGNTFGAVNSAPSSECIRLDATLSGAWTITNNRHRPFSGTASLVGLTISAGNPRMVVAENDFDFAGTPYAGSTILLTCGPSVPIPRLQVTGTPTTIDVGALLNADRVWLDLGCGVTTVSDLPNAKVGTRYILCNTTTNNFTLDRTNSALPGGVNAVLGQYDTIELLCVSTVAPKFVALSPVNANS